MVAEDAPATQGNLKEAMTINYLQQLTKFFLDIAACNDRVYEQITIINKIQSGLKL
jgi:hypothetical protein